jgi:tetratricopeptide (TPR) repeat protein
MNDEEQGPFWTALDAARYAECLERARRLRDESSHPFYEYLVGEVLRRLGQLAEAERIIRAVYSESHSFRGLAEASLGKLLIITGKLEEAVSWLKRATVSSPENQDTWNYLSIALTNQGRLNDAAEVLKEGLARADSHRDELYLNLGRTFRAMEDYPAALECFDKALNLTPDYRLALDDRADILKALSIRGELSIKLF